jgi:putative sterol carrier protein
MAAIARRAIARLGLPIPTLLAPGIDRMDIQTATEQLRAKVGEDCGLGAVLKFDCGADGVVVIDATKVPNTLSNDAARVADCTVALGVGTLGDLLSGELEPTTGFMMGKFKVSGDMSVALKLQRIV